MLTLAALSRVAAAAPPRARAHTASATTPTGAPSAESPEADGGPAGEVLDAVPGEVDAVPGEVDAVPGEVDAVPGEALAFGDDPNDAAGDRPSSTLEPAGPDPYGGETAPDSWLAGLPTSSSWFDADELADLTGIAFAPDETDALMRRSSGMPGGVELSIAYRRREDRARTATETGRPVDELWLVATWSR